MTKYDMSALKLQALEARKTLVRIASKSGSVHIGSSLSEIEILISLYEGLLNVRPDNVTDQNRDRFILSKGHAALGLYIVLSQYGFIPKEEIENYCKDGTKLAVHPVYNSAPGIEATSGSLGHSLPMAVGMAIAAKRAGSKSKFVVLMSDGECDEGSNWEAILLAGHHGLDNLTVIIDYNKIQSFGSVKEVLDLEPFADKWTSARWRAKEVDGHSFEELLATYTALPFEKGKPSVIIAHTVKGKGVPHMENTLESHYKNVKPEELEKVLASIY